MTSIKNRKNNGSVIIPHSHNRYQRAEIDISFFEKFPTGPPPGIKIKSWQHTALITAMTLSGLLICYKSADKPADSVSQQSRDKQQH
ncbi:hypothetical protein [Klebsiella oxytoca]|uniref:Uncharacterized protein n=1 Tax=Klebsiella oxytoca TaxID=571 RepID=A0A6B8MZI2_KLEOX|nr:hypothetical protein [Klebsiella oxytoca]QGN38830.1 hypothetical protein GJ746_16690 [Klebsiella oxytoca]